MERRLSAILAADMVGFSRLMEADEVGTLQRQKVHRAELIDPNLEEFHGRIVKEMGDGFLVEFPSVVDAVQCAVNIQQAMVGREAETSDDKRIQYRVGINLGDIIIEDDDIFGDGVNVAARLEQMAEPGGICISGTAYDHLISKIEVGYESLGDVQVKNIERPIRAYRVLTDIDQVGETIGNKQTGIASIRRFVSIAAVFLIAIIAGGGWWWSQQPDFEPANPSKYALKLPEKPSIAVLPFDNLSGDPSQDYLGDGLTENIIAVLAYSPDLLVIARNSVFTYKDKPVKVQEVAEQLGVRYVLEGSVQKSGDHLRVTAQLIDALNGRHIWAERYDRDLASVNLFELQDDITRNILVEMNVKLAYGNVAADWKEATEDLETFRLSIEARSAILLQSLASINRAAKLYAEIVNRKPNGTLGRIGLGWTHFTKVANGLSKSPQKDLQQSRELVESVIKTHPDDPHALVLLAHHEMIARRHDEALRLVDRALEIYPSSGEILAHAGSVESRSGRPKEAIIHLKKAMRVQPYYPNWIPGVVGYSHAQLGNNKEAKAIWQSLYGQKTNDVRMKGWALQGLIYWAVKDGNMDKAKKYVAELLEIDPKFSITRERQKSAYIKNQEFAEESYSIWAKAGIPENPPLKLPDKPSIAVLPFNNMSGDKEQEYFADGMTEDIITDLSNIAGLFVIARNSSFVYKGKSVDIKTVGRELGVRFVLEGSVRRVGNNVRINAQLINAQSGGHVWAERFDGSLEDVFALQDQVTAKITKAMAVKLALGKSKKKIGKANPEALKLYWKGRSDLFKLKGLEIGRLGPSIENKLRRALELDADNPEIQATLGLLHYLGTRTGRGSVGQFSTERARQLAERSLQIKKTGPAMMLKAAILFEDDGRPTDAIKLGKKAIVLAPNDLLSLEIFASMLLRTGRLDEALEHLLKVRRLDPHGSLGRQGMGLGLALFLAGNAEAAIPILKNQSTTEFVSYIPVEYFYLTAALSAAGQDDEARAMSSRYVKRCRSPDFQTKAHMMAWCNLFALKNALLFTFKFQNEDIISPLLKELRKAGFPEEPE